MPKRQQAINWINVTQVTSQLWVISHSNIQTLKPSIPVSSKSFHLVLCVLRYIFIFFFGVPCHASRISLGPSNIGTCLVLSNTQYRPGDIIYNGYKHQCSTIHILGTCKGTLNRINQNQTRQVNGTATSEVTVVIIRHVDGLVQDCSNSSALAMELLQSCTKPSMSCIQLINSFLWQLAHPLLKYGQFKTTLGRKGDGHRQS